MTNPTTTIWSLPKAKKPRARFFIEITTGGTTTKTWGSRRKLVQMFDDLHSDLEKLEQIQEMTVTRIVKRPATHDYLFDLCYYSLDTLEYFTYHGDL